MRPLTRRADYSTRSRSGRPSPEQKRADAIVASALFEILSLRPDSGAVRSVTIAAAVTAPATAATAAISTASATPTIAAPATTPSASAAAATPTVAAAATAATTSAAAISTPTIATAATATGGAFFAGTGNVDGQGAAAEVFAVEQIHRFLRLVGRTEFNEGKPTGFAGELVEHEIHARHHSSSAEMVLNVAIQGLIRQIAHEEPRVIVHS